MLIIHREDESLAEVFIPHKPFYIICHIETINLRISYLI